LAAWTNPRHDGSCAHAETDYNWCIDAAGQPYASGSWRAVSFAEAIASDPPDIMLLPMSLARPKRAVVVRDRVHDRFPWPAAWSATRSAALLYDSARSVA